MEDLWLHENAKHDQCDARWLSSAYFPFPWVYLPHKANCAFSVFDLNSIAVGTASSILFLLTKMHWFVQFSCVRRSL